MEKAPLASGYVELTRTRNDAARWLASKEIIADLLRSATELLPSDHNAARDCIMRASALLQPSKNARPIAPPRRRGGLTPRQVANIEQFIEKTLPAAITLADLRQVAGLSRGYLTRAFRASFGVSPGAFVRIKRMERAKSLMLTTTLPLSLIALECGFADQSHLSRVFRQITGSTPQRWRHENDLPQSVCMDQSQAEMG
jgi:AraC family transcriptional regulator